MTLKLGRVGTDISLYDPATWQRNGNSVSLSGDLGIGVSSVTDCVTLTEQLLGLVNNSDEPVVACAWTQEAWFDGYYVVESVNVDAMVTSLNHGKFPYSIQLRKVADGASPTIDVTLLGAVRTNGNGIVSAQQTVWAPYDMANGYAAGSINQQFNTTAQTRLSETGTLAWVVNTGVTAVTNTFASFDVSASDYYDGTCTVRSGTTLRRVIGARMKRLPTNWEISNGLIRITPGASTAQLQTEMWDGTAWEDAKSYKFNVNSATADTFSTATGWGDVSIVRNSPECATIRLVAAIPGGAAGFYTVDVTVQRGRYWCDVVFRNVAGAVTGLGISRSTAEAATSLANGGIRATSNDAAGNRYLLACSQATTTDLTQGHVRATGSSAYVNLMIGYELNGSTSVSPNTAPLIFNEWYYPIEERMVPRVR